MVGPILVFLLTYRQLWSTLGFEPGSPDYSTSLTVTPLTHISQNPTLFFLFSPEFNAHSSPADWFEKYWFIILTQFGLFLVIMFATLYLLLRSNNYVNTYKSKSFIFSLSSVYISYEQKIRGYFAELNPPELFTILHLRK